MTDTERGDGLYANDEWLSCRRKVKFTSAGKACRAVARARQRSGHMNIREYKCQYCGSWHIGHQPTGGSK